MKIRNGFVSNSSSSSFILKNKEELKKAKELNMSIYKVSTIIKLFKPIKNKLDKINAILNSDKINDNIPFFLINDYMSYGNSIPMPIEYERLIELEEKYPGCHITGTYDRDEAYKEGIDFEQYEGDL